MGKATGFMEYGRRERPYRPVGERVQSWDEFVVPLPELEIRDQGARCMDCGIPFCHTGCPVNNIIPEWNDLVYRSHWRQALLVLHSTNNFPEFTGRICPAPCEEACTLNINDAPVSIKSIECAIIDRGWSEGWIVPEIANYRTGKHIAIVGSGPAGIAAAQQLARVGHEVTVFEKETRIGGLMRYGIPDFKFEKYQIDRRINQMEAEGVVFKPNVHVGVDLPCDQLIGEYDAILLAGGAEYPRDIKVPGRELAGIHFAMDYLVQQNKRLAGDLVPEIGPDDRLIPDGQHVVVIGGGDTGSDCIGTANRHNAASVTQLEILPRPPDEEDKGLTWPRWPLKLRTSASHEEGAERDWSVSTKAFQGNNGRVQTLQCCRVVMDRDSGGQMTLQDIPGSDFEIQADLVLLAMGFVHTVHTGLVEELDVALDYRGNIAADTDLYQTSIPKVFVAGDMRRGQSLVVWAIREGRQAARAIDMALMGKSDLPF